MLKVSKYICKEAGGVASGCQTTGGDPYLKWFNWSTKGYFYINPLLALSLAITIFSFAGIPPLIGFFGKQMVLSAALYKGYIFLSLVAIITSVIGAVYYLNIIKEMFFFLSEYRFNIEKINNILNLNDNYIKLYNKIISSYISITISTITIIIVLFIVENKLWLRCHVGI